MGLGTGGAGADTYERAHTLIWAATQAHAAGQQDAVDDAVVALVALTDGAAGRSAVHTAYHDVIRSIIARLWAGGWQPADLARMARRRLERDGQELLADAMADELSGYAPTTIDPRWSAQLEGADSGVWWPADRTYLDARRQSGLGGWDLAVSVVHVLELLAALPPLQQIGPVPGQARPTDRRTTPATEVDPKILERVRALLAKAESTTFEAEAEALTAGAQSLMARHSIDAALLAASQHRSDSEPRGRRIGVDNPYESPKALLLNAIADANRCRTAWTKEFGFCTVVGHPADLDAVETLFTSLLVQATHAMVAEGSRTDRRGRSRTRGFRQSFLSAYAARIGERLHEVTRAETEAAAADTDRTGGRELVPLLTARAEAVEAAFTEIFPAVVQRRTRMGRDAEGWASGRSAADRAHLGGKPVGRRSA